MSQLSAPAVPNHQSQLEAAVAAVQPGAQGQASNLGTPQAGLPYQVVDWSSLGYTLPAPMYATL